MAAKILSTSESSYLLPLTSSSVVPLLYLLFTMKDEHSPYHLLGVYSSFDKAKLAAKVEAVLGIKISSLNPTYYVFDYPFLDSFSDYNEIENVLQIKPLFVASMSELLSMPIAEEIKILSATIRSEKLKESKELKEGKESKELKEGKESKELKEGKELKESKELKSVLYPLLDYPAGSPILYFIYIIDPVSRRFSFLNVYSSVEKAIEEALALESRVYIPPVKVVYHIYSLPFLDDPVLYYKYRQSGKAGIVKSSNYPILVITSEELWKKGKLAERKFKTTKVQQCLNTRDPITLEEIKEVGIERPDDLITFNVNVKDEKTGATKNVKTKSYPECVDNKSLFDFWQTQQSWLYGNCNEHTEYLVGAENEDEGENEIIAPDEPYDENCQRFYRLSLPNGTFYISEQDKESVINGFNHGLDYWDLNLAGATRMIKGGGRYEDEFIYAISPAFI